MRGKLTKLLTVSYLLYSLFSLQAIGQCSYIVDNYSGQVASSLCAPVDLVMDVRYKFVLPVDPSKVQILYVWNDGNGSTDLVPAINEGNNFYSASATHLYDPDNDECSYTAEAYVVYDGQQCVSSSRQEQTFSAWARDNENGGVIQTEPERYQFCEGEDINAVRFEDASVFNCNLAMEPDKPNLLQRWVQFIYGTTSIGGDRIPNITITDPLGNVYQMTDGDGNSLPPVSGPIIEIPADALGPNQLSWPISAPAGGIAGDIFEITMRNWNICNPYDDPFDSIQTSDPINGDYDPITTTALIEIITTPPQISNPSLEFCAGSPIHLTLSTSGGAVNWYADSAMTMPIHHGNSFDPTGAPTYIDNTVGGTYTYWVTETLGMCASAPSRVSFEIFDTPAPAPDAGKDTVICRDNYILQANTPVIGIGEWSTTSSAIIADRYNPVSAVSNLTEGDNHFLWTVRNGPCISEDEVIITRDLQPDPASAGPDISFCNTAGSTLQGNNPTNYGVGTWTVAMGNADFNDAHDPQAQAFDLQGGVNLLAWTIYSRYGACITTSDTLNILRDVSPDPAFAGPDRGVCDSATIRLAGLSPTNNGSGTWSLITGTGTISDVHAYNSMVSNLAFGTNEFRWTVVSEYGICPGSNDIVRIMRDEAPDPAMAGSDQFLCSQVTIPLGANAATIGSGTWSIISSPTVVAPVFNPSVHDPNATLLITSGNEGIYDLTWTLVNGSCRSSDTVRIDFGLPVPPANAGLPDTVCGTDVLLKGNDAGIGTGTWRKIVGTGNTTFMPDAHFSSPMTSIETGEEGLYSFEWRITSGSCPASSDTVAIFFKVRPGVPSANGESRCGPGSFTLTSTPGTNGDINRWYENATISNYIIESNNYTTPSLSASEDYWVASYDQLTGCESYRRRVDITINEIPSTPAVSDVQHCGNANFILPSTVGANGTTNRWYNVDVGGSPIAEDDTFRTPVLSSPTTYWISSYNSITGCEGSRVPLHIQIDPIPDMPAVKDTGRCGEGGLVIHSEIGANGNRNLWYDSQNAGTLLDTVTDFVTPYLTAGAAYWVTSVNVHTGCRSPRSRVVANIYPVPAYPQSDDVSHCGPDTIELLSVPGASGTISRWYDSLTGGNMLYEGNRYITDFLTTTTRFYVSSYNENTGCESSRREVTAIILPTPGVNSIIGPSKVGINQSNVIYSVNYQPGSTYTWTIPPGINLLLKSQNFVILEFPNLGNYNLSVTETNSLGCQGPPATKPVIVDENLILLDIQIIDGEACVNQDLHLSVVPSGGTPSYTFAWSGDVQYLNDISISNPIFTTNQPGNFQLIVKVTDINLNENADTIQISIHGNPRAEIIADTIVCAGVDLPVNAIVSEGSGIYTSYLWSGQTSPLSIVNMPNTLFNTYASGIYALKFTVTDNYGCTGIDSIEITNDSPRAVYSSDALPACSPLKIQFTNNSENTDSYYWEFDDGFTSNEENPNHTFYNTSTSVKYYNVRLTATSANHCSQTTNDFITVYPNPELVINTYPDKACAPADILLSSTPGGFRYDWDFGDGNSTTGEFSTLHTFHNETDRDTTYNIKLFSTSYFGCEDTAYKSIIVHPSPEASFTVDPTSQMIPDKTVYIVNTTKPGNWQYFWKFGDDSTYSYRDPGDHIYPGPGDYMISLRVIGEHCSDSTWTSIEIVPHPPVAEFKPVEPGCMPLTIQFENTSSYSNSFLWEFGDGAVSNKPNPEYTYYEWGSYKIKLTAWGDDGSTDSYSVENEVYVLPNAFFELAPRVVNVNEEAVHFFNKSDNRDYPETGNTYLWDFGDGNGSDEMSPKHTYSREGTYTVTLNVWTEKGCYDLYEYTAAVIVEPTGKIVFPNVFSPQALNPENRVFKPAIMDYVEEYHLMIFNRWGELIFESFNRDTGWDGMADGKMAKEDVYIWKVEGKYSHGEPFTETGDVTLLH